MKQVKIVIEKTKNHYSAYAENVEGVNGGGDTPEEAKQSIVDCIRIIKKYYKPHNIPTVLKGDYELVYRFDTESLLNYYRKIFTNSALERLTGINQRQLQHYSSGLKKPRPAQKKRIENALHKLGNELLAIVL